MPPNDPVSFHPAEGLWQQVSTCKLPLASRRLDARWSPHGHCKQSPDANTWCKLSSKLMIVAPLLHNLLLGKSMIPIDLKTGCSVASVSLGQNSLVYLLQLAPKRHQHQSSVNTHICFPLPAVVQYFGCNEGGEVTHTVRMTLRKDLWWCLLLAVSKRERFQNFKRFISEH